MNEVTDKEKQTLGHKFLEFQKTGLVSYRKYLSDQLESASKSNIKKAYAKYIEEQLVMNAQKIADIDGKLKG